MDLAMIGLGRMGGGMARRLLAAGHRVVAYSRSGATARALAEDHGAIATATVEEARDGLTSPRVFWLMVPAGEATGEAIDRLGIVAEAGDIVVDGGNSHYRDTLARGASLERAGIRLVDAGVSGGVRGEADGYCVMLGGDEETIVGLRPLLDSLAAPSGWARVGGAGAGHFVKMVHNGVEYGLMQAYAEGFAILKAKRDLDLDPARIAEVWRHGSVVRSWLLDLVAEALAADDELAGFEPRVADSGEGRWTAEEALELGVAAPVIVQALIARYASREGVEVEYSRRMVSALRSLFGGHDPKGRH